MKAPFKSSIYWLPIALIIFLAASCGEPRAGAEETGWKSDQKELLEDLENADMKLEAELAEINEQILIADSSMTEKYQELRAEVKDGRNHIQNELSNVKEASAESWETVHQEAVSTINEVDRELQELVNELDRDWFDINLRG